VRLFTVASNASVTGTIWFLLTSASGRMVRTRFFARRVFRNLVNQPGRRAFQRRRRCAFGFMCSVEQLKRIAAAQVVSASIQRVASIYTLIPARVGRGGALLQWRNNAAGLVFFHRHQSVTGGNGGEGYLSPGAFLPLVGRLRVEPFSRLPVLLSIEGFQLVQHIANRRDWRERSGSLTSAEVVPGPGRWLGAARLYCSERTATVKRILPASNQAGRRAPFQRPPMQVSLLTVPAEARFI
jgi:hypothetical protein